MASGTQAPAEAGFRIVVAHTDRPERSQGATALKAHGEMSLRWGTLAYLAGPRLGAIWSGYVHSRRWF